MQDLKWMKLDEVIRSIPAMHTQGVSTVARGIDKSKQTKEGWVQAYIATDGDPIAMAKRLTGRSEWETWKDRRMQFLARHLKQIEDRNESLWKNGEPSRHHLALVAWGYTPTPKEFKEWLKTQPTIESGEWKKGVKIIKNNPYKAVIEGDLAITIDGQDIPLRRNSSIGYNSWAWTTQDWRSLFLHSDNSITYDAKCGADGTKLPSGKPRLCLPIYVIDKLIKTKSGRDILINQIKMKQRAEIGERVTWHPKIKELYRELEAITPLDRPSLRKNPKSKNISMLVDETMDYRKRYGIKNAIVAIFNTPIQLFKVIDENEYRIITENGIVTEENWEDPNKNYGTSWSEDLDEIIDYAINEKNIGKLVGQLYILSANGQNKKFIHLNGYDRNPTKLLGTKNPNHYTVIWSKKCSTSLGCSIKFDLSDVIIYPFFY